MLIPRHELRRSSRASTAESLREEGEVQDREDLEKLQEVERHRASFFFLKTTKCRQFFGRLKVEGKVCVCVFVVFFVCVFFVWGGKVGG